MPATFDISGLFDKSADIPERGERGVGAQSRPEAARQKSSFNNGIPDSEKPSVLAELRTLKKEQSERSARSLPVRRDNHAQLPAVKLKRKDEPER